MTARGTASVPPGPNGAGPERLFGTAALTPGQLATVAPFPFIVGGADELRRVLRRRHDKATAR